MFHFTFFSLSPLFAVTMQGKGIPVLLCVAVSQVMSVQFLYQPLRRGNGCKLYQKTVCYVIMNIIINEVDNEFICNFIKFIRG